MQHAKLLEVEDERRFIQTLVQAVVGSVDSDTKFNDSILLLNIAEDYNGVLDVLNSELGACISRHSTLSGAEVLQIAKSILEHYQGIGVRLERRRIDTLNRLIKINEALGWMESGRLDDALVVRCTFAMQLKRKKLMIPLQHFPVRLWSRCTLCLWTPAEMWCRSCGPPKSSRSLMRPSFETSTPSCWR